jgi:hypothetical protein
LFCFVLFSYIFRVIQCAFHFPSFSFFFLIPGRTMCISYFRCFSVFLAMFQVIECLCLIFHDFLFYRHIPGSTVCITHFSRFSGFSPYSRSWSVHFSFSTFFSIFRYIPGPTVCFFFIFYVFQCFSPYSRS